MLVRSILPAFWCGSCGTVSTLSGKIGSGSDSGMLAQESASAQSSIAVCCALHILSLRSVLPMKENP